jgi:hypothetical protein
MSRQFTILPVALALLGALTGPIAAQAAGPTVEAADLFTGKGPAATVRLKTLDQNWRRVTISGPAELKGGGIGQLAGGIFGAMLGSGAPPSSGYTPPQYTQGATTTLGGETFLIVYRPNLKGLDLAALMQVPPGAKPPSSERLTEETALMLTLVNVRSITSLSDFRPFNLKQELAESAKATEDELKTIEQLQRQNGPGGQAQGGALENAVPEVRVAPEPVPDRIAPYKPAPAKKPIPKKK